MVTIEEKIKLAEEAGLSNWANIMKSKLETEEEIKRLTDLKFKLTTREKIREQICVKYWDFANFRDVDLGVKIIWTLSSIASFGIVLLITVATCRKKSELSSMPLPQWTDNLPVGALYAIKEAKEKGLGNFWIYYPVTERSARLKTDPVITAETSNGMGTRLLVEVFAWDDGKVYE